jgi:signal transduction histidine kinase/ActR/RegA family two-component response regulator
MKLSLNFAFAVMLGLLAVVVAGGIRASTDARDSQRRLMELQSVRLELTALLAAYVDAETGQRGYMLTGDEKYLAPYEAARASLIRGGNRLKAMLAPKAAIADLHARLAEIGHRKLDELAQTIQLRREQGAEAALDVIRRNEGKELMDQLRSTAAGIDAGLDRQMREEIARAGQARNVANAVDLGSAALVAAGIVMLWTFTARRAAERERLLVLEKENKERVEQALAAERAAHSEAAHANKLKDEFLAVVSHELRTPLNAIMGWVSLLREGPEDEAELHEGIETIDRNVRAQARLVDDLLDVSRIISGKVRLHIAEVDLRAVAVSVCDALRPAAEARGVGVSLTSTAEATEVLGDADRLQQIVWNLLSNAIKFTPRDGRVEVALSLTDSHVILEVSDNGRGISPEFLPRIFDRFTQQDVSTTRGQAGLGLGLSISRHLVELHGGKIYARSGGVGKGASFRVEIPVVAVRELKQQLSRRAVFMPQDGVAPSSQPIHFDGLRVLAVDDQADTLAVIRRVLMRAGADVRTALSVPEAQAVLAEWVPNVILSDIGMPGKDGYAFLRELRAEAPPRVRDIPAVALTAFAREMDRKEAIDAGFNDHLAKPVDAVALLQKIASVAAHAA